MRRCELGACRSQRECALSSISPCGWSSSMFLATFGRSRGHTITSGPLSVRIKACAVRFSPLEGGVPVGGGVPQHLEHEAQICLPTQLALHGPLMARWPLIEENNLNLNLNFSKQRARRRSAIKLFSGRA